MRRIYFNISWITLLISAMMFFDSCHKSEPAPVKPVQPPAPPPPKIQEIAGTWTPINTPPGNAILTTSTGMISFSPTTFLGTFLGYDLNMNPNRSAYPMWYSGDHGVSWTPVLSHSDSNYYYYTLQVDVMNKAHAVIYSETDSTFYNSTDGGKTWGLLSHLNKALIPQVRYTDSALTSILNVLIDSSFDYYGISFYGVSGNRLFALRQNAHNPDTATMKSNYLMASDDNGATWQTVYNFVSYSKDPMELYAVGSTLVQINYGQIVGSGNNGLSWNVINSNSPVTFPGGVLSSGTIVALDAINNTIYMSHDSTKSWQLFYQDNGGLGPVLAFDSIIFTPAYYMSGNRILCSNSQTINWIGADNGLQTGGAYTNLYVDDTYLYAFISASSYPSTPGSFYRRPRSDFKGI